MAQGSVSTGRQIFSILFFIASANLLVFPCYVQSWFPVSAQQDPTLFLSMVLFSFGLGSVFLFIGLAIRRFVAWKAASGIVLMVTSLLTLTVTFQIYAMQVNTRLSKLLPPVNLSFPYFSCLLLLVSIWLLIAHHKAKRRLALAA